MSAFKLQVKNEHDCVLLNIVELDGTIVTLLKISDTEMSALSLKYNGTRLHSACEAQNAQRKITHRPCCEHFQMGTIFFLQNYNH